MSSKDGKKAIVFLIAVLFITLILIIFLKFPYEKSSNDNTWQVFLITGIITFFNLGAVVISAISTYQSSQKGRKKLRLEYHVKDNAPLMATKGTEVPNVDTIIKGKMGSLYIVTIKIQNSGNTSITPKDFSKEMSLNFGEGAEILKVDVLERRPSGRKIEFMTDDHNLLIEPMLLNRKDTVTLAVLLKGFVDKIALIGNGQGIIPEVLKR